MDRAFHAFILLVFASAFLAGCTNPVDIITGNHKAEPRLEISPITIMEEKETIITGEERIKNGTSGGTNGAFNITIPDYTYEPNRTLFVFFINVSYTEQPEDFTNERQGEAILVKKGDADVLIDTGISEHSSYLVNFLKQKGVDDIELLVLTHARPENYGGLDAILDNFKIEQFMWNNDTNNDATYAALVEKAESKALKTIQSSYALQLSLNGISILVINPRDGTDRLFNVDNDAIALKITDRNFCLMTTADILYGGQNKISGSSAFNPQCDILQIPNYGLGAATSKIDLFLTKVAPKSAIITGSYIDIMDERYTIYEKLRIKGIPYYRTFNTSYTAFDKNTTNVVRITSDGTNYSITYQ